MHSLYKQNNLPYMNVKVCPKCQTLVSLDKETCDKCSYNFITKETKVEYKDITDYAKQHAAASKNVKANSTIQEKTEEFETHEKTAKATKEKFIFCDNCGAKIIGSQKYCGGCGVKVSKMICPSCDQIIESNLSFCPYCGKKVNENKESNVEKTTQHVDHQFVTSDQKVINIKFEEQTKTEETPIIDEKEQVEEIKTETKSNFAVKMGRKRVFASLQLIYTLILIAIVVMVPILTKQSFIESIIPTFTNSSNETIVTLKDMFAFIIESIKTQSLDISIIADKLKNNDGYIFTSLKLVNDLLNSYPDYKLLISFIVVCVVYGCLTISLLTALISSIIHLFKKNSYKGTALGLITLSFLLGCLLIYSNIFTYSFANYDSYMLYGFAVSFLFWFLIKIIFGKESKIYKKEKMIKKLKKK